MTRTFQPHAYQLDMQDHIYQVPRAGLFAGMGTGKTVTTLTALSNLALVDDPWPVLVLAPLRVAQSTWPDEVRKWSHLSSVRVSPIVGTPAERRAALRTRGEVYTINYENIPWLIEELAGKWPFRRVVADESTKLKGFRTRQGGVRTKALAKVAHTCDGWINLTGTPSPNGIQDLWGQTWFLDQGHRLGRTWSAFVARWFQSISMGQGGFSKIVPWPHSQDEVMAKLRDICLSVTFPWAEEPIVRDVHVELPTKAMRQYREMEREMFIEIAGTGIEAFNAGSKTMKCRQIASGAIYRDESATEFADVHDVKIQALESVIEEAAGMPVLVSYYFKHSLERLLKALKGARHLDDDPQTIRDWNAGKIPVLLAHPKSAGHGLNLQDGGNIIAVFDHDWNLEEYQQIIERIGPTRQKQAGYDRPTYVYHLIARGTVDELVMERRESKREVQDILMNYMKKRGV